MKGISPLELAGMRESSVANDVLIWRPLLQHSKVELYDFAHEWGIPYLKDSTPLWSTRGKIRNQLMPLLSDIYGEGYLNNLSRVAQASEDAGRLMKYNVYNPFLQSIRRFKCGVCVNVIPFIKQPNSFWKEMLKEMMHSMGMNMVREAAVRNFVERISKFSLSDEVCNSFSDKRVVSSKREGWLELRKGFFTFLKHNGDFTTFLDGILSPNPFCLSQSNHSPCVSILNPTDFTYLANDDTNKNICFVLEESVAELLIRGWRISICVIQSTEFYSQFEAENIFEYLLRGTFEYGVNYPSYKNPLIGLISGNRSEYLLSDCRRSKENGDGCICEDVLMSQEENWRDDLYSLQYPAVFKNIDTKIKLGLPLLNVLYISNNFDELEISQYHSNCEDKGVIVFNYTFVGNNP